MDITNTAWVLNNTDYIEFISHNLLLYNNNQRGTWSTDGDIINFDIDNCKYTGKVANNVIIGVTDFYDSKWNFEAVIITRINQFYLERLPYTTWILHDADKDKNKIKFQFDIHHKISGEFSSWSFNDDGLLTIIYNRYNIVYKGRLEKGKISGIATNALGEEWEFRAERLGVNFIKKAEYKYLRNQFVEANKLYALHFNHFGYKPTTSNAIYLKNYLMSLIKVERPEVKIDKSNPYYTTLRQALNHYREELKKKKQLKGSFINGYGIYSYNSDSIINFGIHKGRSISEVINSSPDYVIWCILNLDRFALEPDLFLNINLSQESDFLIAVEYNFIKLLFKSMIIYDRVDEGYDESEGSSYSWEDAYYDGGGGDEWSDPSEYW